MNDETLKKIISRLAETGKEWNAVDAKQNLYLKETGEKAEFVKDVVAMANNRETSYIIIGLKDSTFEPIKKLEFHYTQNDINQILCDKIDPPIVVKYDEIEFDGNEYATVEITGYNAPYIVADDISCQPTDRKKVRIYKGTIFVRHEDRTEGISRTELDALYNNKLRRLFEGETSKAYELAANRPSYWEFLLTEELLGSKLNDIRKKYNELDRGLIFRKTKKVSGKEFFDWIHTKLDDLVLLVDYFKTSITEELPASWGPPGVSGNPEEIKSVIDKIIVGCNELIEWEAEIKTITPPESFQSLRDKLKGWTNPIFTQIEVIPQEIKKIFDVPSPQGTFQINLVFRPPDGLGEYMAEIEKMQNDPGLWASDFLS